MDIFSDPSDNVDDDGKGEDQGVDGDRADRIPIAKVEPYGAEELREVMIGRKQVSLCPHMYGSAMQYCVLQLSCYTVLNNPCLA